MRSKRLELQEALKNKSPSMKKRQEALKIQRPSTIKPRSASVNNQRAEETVTDAVDERLGAAAFKKQRSLTRKTRVSFVVGTRAKEIVTGGVDERLSGVALEKQSLSATKPRVSFSDSPRANEIMTDAVDERLNAAALELIALNRSKGLEPQEALKNQRPSTTKQQESLKNQRPSTKKQQEALPNQRPSTTKQQQALQKQKYSTKKPRVAFVDGARANETVTDVVDEVLNVDDLEKPRSLKDSRLCSAFVNGSKTKEIATDAVDERHNAVTLQKQRLSTTAPCSTFVYCRRANKIVTGPVDERLKPVDGMLDSGGDIRDEDTDTLDTWSDIRDEDADILDSDGNNDMQIVEDQLLPTNSHKDREIHDSNGNSDIQIAEDHSSTNSDEDADILDADRNGDMQIVEDQSLPTNSEEVASSSRKRKRNKVRRQVTDPHSESTNGNCTGNVQGSTSRPSGIRKLIMFDIYGRPCDVGSEKLATAIGRAVRGQCRPAIESWKIVPNSIKENIWKDVVANYVVPEVYKPNVLSRAGLAWRKWKHQLRLELDKHETISERKINMPERFITKREDWESFVDFCNTDKDRKRRAIGKKANGAVEFLQSCGRKGIYRKIYELEKESPTGEVNRSKIFLDTHISKTINDDPESSSISDTKMRLIKELVENNPDGQKDIDNDAVALVCGRDSRGLVRGMGGGVSRTKVHASAAIAETLRKVQQENKRLQSDNELLLAQLGKNAQNQTSTTPSNQSVSDVQDCTPTPSNQFVSQAPDVPNLPARLHLSPPASNLPARSRLAPPTSNLPASSRLAPPASNLPASSRLAPLRSNLPASSCFIKNFKGRTIALGSFNTAEPPTEHVYSLIIEDIFDRDAELFDKDGKLGDIIIGGVINWPKACVGSNLPANSCFIRNFKRTIAFGSFSTAADPQMEHVYRVTVKEVYDRDAELFDTDGKLGDIMIGGVINWPKACVKPCRQ